MTPPQSQTPETKRLALEVVQRMRAAFIVLDKPAEQTITEAVEAVTLSLETRLNEALKEADRQTEIADAMTDYSPDSKRELDLIAERTSLLAQIAVKDEALKHGIACTRCPDCVDQMNNALTNSPAAAQEMVEELDKLRKCKEVLDEVNSLIELHVGVTFTVNAIKELYKEKQEMVERMEKMETIGNELVKCVTSPNRHEIEIQNAVIKWKALSTTKQPEGGV